MSSVPSVARRLARYAGLVVLVAGLNFALPRVLPGSPLTAGGPGDTVLLPAAARRALAETYRLDAPLTLQVRDYVGRLVRGDLGWSMVSHRPVARMIGERLPWTLGLVGGAVLAAAALGGLLGWWAAGGRRRPARLAMATTVAAGAVPEFLVAMAAIALVATRLRWFPPGGGVDALAQATGGLRLLGDLLWHAALPGLVLVVALTPAFALLFRNALVPVLGQPFLLAARAKGLAPRRVAWHALRNALPPVVTLLGLRLAAAVAGAAVVERLFAYPGIGLLLYEAVAARDYPVLQGVVFTSSLAILTMTLALDLLAGWIDPRAGATP
jgi:peptide/nickel transport system permease protein